MVKAWKEAFKDFEDVSIFNKAILSISADAVVSPANSFGYMDGGLDLHLSEQLGWKIQNKLIKEIKDLPMRELLIGQSLTLRIDNKDFKYLISVPTMRVPTEYLIKESVNAYLAMKALMIEYKNNTDIQTINIPAFCKGVGEMPVEIVARQMAWAFSEIYLGRKINHTSFEDMRQHHFLLNEKKTFIKY